MSFSIFLKIMQVLQLHTQGTFFFSMQLYTKIKASVVLVGD